MAKLFKGVPEGDQEKNMETVCDAVAEEIKETKKEEKGMKKFLKKKSTKIGAIIVGAAAIVGGVAYAISNGKKDEEEGTEEPKMSFEEEMKELDEMEAAVDSEE